MPIYHDSSDLAECEPRTFDDFPRSVVTQKVTQGFAGKFDNLFASRGRVAPEQDPCPTTAEADDAATSTAMDMAFVAFLDAEMRKRRAFLEAAKCLRAQYGDGWDVALAPLLSAAYDSILNYYHKAVSLALVEAQTQALVADELRNPE